jgi:hypothetical protein
MPGLNNEPAENETHQSIHHPWDRWKILHESVNVETFNNRMAICQACPFYLESKICSKCGCYMPDKAKSMNDACPIKKW